MTSAGYSEQLNGGAMSRGKAERNSHDWVPLLKWTSVILAAFVIPHAVVAGVVNWPPVFVSVHVSAAVFAGLAALVIACSHARDQREAEAERQAYHAGRVDTITAEIDEFERRT